MIEQELIPSTGASFHRGKSKQDYGTPHEFCTAVERLIKKPIVFDLAASDTNSKHPYYFTQRHNALIQKWSEIKGLLWLNPPYAHIEPWAHKCKEEMRLGAEIAMLVPASVSTDWWDMHVHNVARVFFARPRITFIGAEEPYPKDLALVYYHPNVNKGYETWRWK